MYWVKIDNGKIKLGMCPQNEELARLFRELGYSSITLSEYKHWADLRDQQIEVSHEQRQGA